MTAVVLYLALGLATGVLAGLLGVGGGLLMVPMLVMMFSMAGIPPLVGFYAKFAVLEAAVNVGLTWLAVVGVVMSLIGAFYYLRVVKAVYFDEATGSAGDALTVGGDMKLVLGVNGLVLLGLGILPNGLYTLCLEAVRQSLGTL